MEDFLFIFLFISTILSIIVLVHFLKMSRNVKEIRKQLNSAEALLSNTEKYESYGYTNKAKESFENYVWAEIRIIFDNTDSGPSSRKRKYFKFREQNETRLKNLGGHWPELDMLKYPELK